MKIIHPRTNQEIELVFKEFNTRQMKIIVKAISNNSSVILSNPYLLNAKSDGLNNVMLLTAPLVIIPSMIDDVMLLVADITKMDLEDVDELPYKTLINIVKEIIKANNISEVFEEIKKLIPQDLADQLNQNTNVKTKRK